MLILFLFDSEASGFTHFLPLSWLRREVQGSIGKHKNKHA